MLQETALRVADRARFTDPVVVASRDHVEAIERQLAPALQRIIVEPQGRNTAPAIALAALEAPPGALLLVLPSDHVVADPAAFLAAVEDGAELAEAGWLVTFGISAERPETGYGYLKRGEPLLPGTWRVAQFIEKPDLETAERLVADGGHDWNGGIFLFRADEMLKAIDAHAADLLQPLRAALAGKTVDGLRVTPDAERFAAVRSVSIDHAVMEHHDRVAMVPVSMGWSDVGSWAALHAIGAKDERGNVVAGNALVVDSDECLIQSDGPVIVTIGVEKLVVVATERAVLVVPIDQSQRAKEAIDALLARRDEQS